MVERQTASPVIVIDAGSRGEVTPTMRTGTMACAGGHSRFGLAWASEHMHLVREAKVAVSPGIGFGQLGDEHVRFALVENEQRIRQAIRGIRKVLSDPDRTNDFRQMDRELLITATDLGLYHTIRRLDGTWDPFRDVFSQTGSPGGGTACSPVTASPPPGPSRPRCRGAASRRGRTRSTPA